MRDEFDLNHLGNFKLVYPVIENPEKAKRFDQYLDQARMIWAEFTGGVRTASSTTIPQIKQSMNTNNNQNNNNNNNNNFNMNNNNNGQNNNSNRARTDPKGVKSKA